ncbi:PAS domain S-box protein [Altericista sp. CCNU0014]|uniref:PAS domain S-box protein n=1 Tax=Altericista sp. CCNU0014 TaxID=3082949 RepID=UPI00384CF042
MITLPGTIHLDRLIAPLMQVAIENAGAETGALILVEDDRLTVVAQCSGSRQCNLEKLTVADCTTIPVSVIHSVERTQETLMLDDAVSESPFSTDPYIQHQQTRSLLCMPILKQSQPIGILYLENNLSTGVFTSDRLQALELLMDRAAISLENARLYEQLKNYAETLERKVEEQTQALQQEIVERQQTEAALRQSEANYRNLLQTANSVIIRYDPQGRIRYINDYGVKLLGYEEHEILGRSLFETIIPEAELSGRDMRPFVRDLLRNPQSYPQGEGENLCRDGRRVWMAWSNQAIFNDQGEVVEILSVGNDTTQRRQAEEALQRSEAKFRTIFENSQVGIFRVRFSDELILNANQRLANLLGFDSPEEIIGLEHSIGYFVNPSDRQHSLELLKRDGELRSYEAQLRKQDGTVFWGLFSSYLNADDDYIEGVLADISDCKQAEAALRQSEANYRNLLQTANSVILRYDPQGRICYINDYGVKLLGYEEHEIVGRTLFETIIPEAELSGRDMRPFVRDLLRNPQSYPKGEGENLCRDGRRIWMEWSNQAIFNDQGEVVEILSVGNDTTQRRRAEEALQRSEAKFRNIFENSQVGIYRTRTCDGLILNANQRFADLLGFDSPEEIVGLEHTTDFNVNPNDRQQFIEVLKRDGEVRSYEIQMRKRDGTPFWGLFSSYLNADDDYIEGVIVDISDRKQAEAALQTSEERLRLALTASNQGLYDLNIKTEEVVINPEYALMLGYDPATFHVTKSTWIESLHPDDRESVLAVYHACITGEVPSYQAEYRHRTQDGQWKWILAVGNVVAWNEFGEPIRALGVVTDIDDRKQAEAALQASEKELQTLIAAIPDPLYVLTSEGQVLDAVEREPNQSCRPIEEQIGKTLHQLLAKEQADEFLSCMQQVLRTQQVLTIEYSHWKAGREIWFSVRIAPIRHEQVIWLVRDITALKQAEEASILEERNRMAREIHDTLAQAFTGILAQVGAANQVLTDDVEATQAHLDLIKELARTGLVEARRSVVALRPQLLEEGSLQSALHRLVAQFRTAALETTLYYEIEGAVYSLPTEVESNLLRMGQEALTNAIKHANADEIRVELVYERDRVCLRVKDNGQGFGVGSIPASEGFGLLGMSERAERIGAQLTIRSQPGQGTEIIVIVNQE